MTTATGKGGRKPAARSASQFGLLAFLAALASLITCYLTIAAEVLLGLGAVGLNADVQAVVMWGFGLLAVYALARDRRRHGRLYPVAVGIAGLAILIGTLYVHYDQRFEVLAYVLLLIAALLNQRAMIASLFERVRRQSEELEGFNRRLASEVDRQVGEIGRLNRLKSFLPPAIAEMVVDEESEARLQSHRQYIACLICDIRNFTAFADQVEPEETIRLLQRYHESLGRLIAEHEGTIAHRAGDGIMVIFNDPVPCERPVLDAVRLGLAIIEVWQDLRRPWQRLGHDIGLGLGIASGYATLGLLGDSTRVDYTAVGNAVNLAARLCDAAEDGELIIDQRAYLDVDEVIEAEPCEPRQAKGLAKPIECYRVTGLKKTA